MLDYAAWPRSPPLSARKFRAGRTRAPRHALGSLAADQGAGGEGRRRSRPRGNRRSRRRRAGRSAAISMPCQRWKASLPPTCQASVSKAGQGDDPRGRERRQPRQLVPDSRGGLLAKDRPSRRDQGGRSGPHRRMAAPREVLAAVTSEDKPVQGCRVKPLGALRYRANASPISWRGISRWCHTRALAQAPASPSTARTPANPMDATAFWPGVWRAAQLGAIPPRLRHRLPPCLGWGCNPDMLVADDLAQGAWSNWSPAQFWTPRSSGRSAGCRQDC